MTGSLLLRRFIFFIAAAGTAIALTSDSRAATPQGKGTDAAADPLGAAVKRYASGTSDYQRLLEEYANAQTEGRSLTPDDKRRYSNAYVSYAYALYRRGDAKAAESRFRKAIGVDEGNPLAHYCLGLLQRKYGKMKEAIESFRAAAKLGAALRDSCREQLTDVVISLLKDAQACIERGDHTTAARFYLFLARNFSGEVEAQALKKLEEIEDSADPLVVAVERHIDEQSEYRRHIQECDAARQKGESLSGEQKRRYSNAYVYYGYVLYCQRDAKQAARRFRQAIAIDEKNALPWYCLGVLHRKSDSTMQLAVSNLRTATRLGGPLQAASEKRLDEISSSLLGRAEAWIKRGSYTRAAECYRFLTANFEGETKAEALDRFKKTEDEIAAERLLIEARREIARGRKIEGRRLLKTLFTTYSWTRAGEIAKKIYRGEERVAMKVKSESPAGEYAAREKWIDLETANCVVYYKNTKYAKTVAKRVEETLERVTEQLQYDDLDWHKDKCKVFVFDDATTWKEFVKESGVASEWADGFAYGPLREVYMHAGDPDGMLNRVLPHELTHIIHREYARDDAYLPLWLLEGLACYNEFSGKETRFGLVKRALASGRMIPLGSLAAFRAYPRGDAVNLFYAESLMLVEFIMDRFGHEGLVRLHKKLRKVEEFDKLVKRTFKMDVEEFERQWLDYIKTNE